MTTRMTIDAETINHALIDVVIEVRGLSSESITLTNSGAESRLYRVTIERVPALIISPQSPQERTP